MSVPGQRRKSWWRANPLRNLPSHDDIVVTISQRPGNSCIRRCGPSGQPQCSGWPDLVTDTHVYEIKSLLTMSAVQRGVGQLLLYGLDWPGRKLVLIGYDASGIKLKSYVEKLGIEMEILEEPEQKPSSPYAYEGNPALTMP